MLTLFKKHLKTGIKTVLATKEKSTLIDKQELCYEANEAVYTELSSLSSTFKLTLEDLNKKSEDFVLKGGCESAKEQIRSILSSPKLHKKPIKALLEKALHSLNNNEKTECFYRLNLKEYTFTKMATFDWSRWHGGAVRVTDLDYSYYIKENMF